MITQQINRGRTVLYLDSTVQNKNQMTFCHLPSLQNALSRKIRFGKESLKLKRISGKMTVQYCFKLKQIPHKITFQIYKYSLSTTIQSQHNNQAQHCKLHETVVY